MLNSANSQPGESYYPDIAEVQIRLRAVEAALFPVSCVGSAPVVRTHVTGSPLHVQPSVRH